MKQILIILIMFFLSHTAYAFEIDLVAPKESAVGEKIAVNVSIGQLKQPINAISGTLEYDSKALKLEQISDGGSVVSLWLKSPQISQEGQIEFAGITPGGLLSGKLFEVEFLTLVSGSYELNLKDLKLVLNDGSGQSYAADSQIARLSVTAMQADTEAVESVFELDKAPPLPFKIEIARDVNVFNNSWFAVFSTNDTQSGINFYELAESRSPSSKELVWQKAQSPYVLADQSRKSYVFVKAVDRQGNETLSVLGPKEKDVNLGNYIFYVIIVGLISAIILVWLRYFKKQNVQKK